MPFQDIFGWMGAVSSTIVYAAPVTQFINVVKGRLNYEETPTFLIGTIYCNCFTWYSYGYFVFSIQVKTCSFLGCILSLLCSIIYLSYEVKNYLKDAILNASIIFTGTWAAYRTYFILFGDDSVVGKACIITSLVALTHPLFLIYRVFREKNYRIIPLEITELNIFGGICWIIYGYMEWDNYIVFVNLLIIFVAVAQIIVVKKYKIKYPSIEQAAAQISTIEIESTGDYDNSKKQDTGEVKIDEESVYEKEKIKAKPVKIVTKKESE